MRLSRLLLASMMILIVASAQARTFEEIKKDGKIIVATEGAFPPFNYFQGPNLTGFEIDVAEALAKKMGVAIEWRALSFDALLAGLRQDRWDLVIASFGITPRALEGRDLHGPALLLGRRDRREGPCHPHGRRTSRARSSPSRPARTYLENVQKLHGPQGGEELPQGHRRARRARGRPRRRLGDRSIRRQGGASRANPGRACRWATSCSWSGSPGREEGQHLARGGA